MSVEQANLDDPRIEKAVAELEEMIRAQYPAAAFEVSRGDDPDGVYLTSTVDVEDTEDVFDVVVDRLLQMQIDEGLPVYVIAVRPLEQVLKELRLSRQVRHRPTIEDIAPQAGA